MKRIFAMILALAIAPGIGLTIAFADTCPPLTHPGAAQRGHVAYLESIYGEKKAEEILDSYGRTDQEAREMERQAEQQEVLLRAGIYYNGSNAYPNQGVVIVPPATQDPSTSSLRNLRIGDRFTSNGTLYQVGRFTQIAGANVLVAYPVTPGGAVLDTQPRYFYL